MTSPVQESSTSIEKVMLLRQSLRRVVLALSGLVIILIAVFSGLSLTTGSSGARVDPQIEIAFLLSGAAFFLLTWNGLKRKIAELCTSIAAWVIFAIGAMALLDHMFVDLLKIPETNPPMPVAIAIGFMLLGTIIWCLSIPKRLPQQVAQLSALATMSIASSVLVDHLHAALSQTFIGHRLESATVVFSFSFFCLGLAGALSRQEYQPCAIFLRSTHIGKLARYLLLLSWGVGIFFALVATFRPALETMVLMLIAGLAGPTVIWLASMKLEKAEEENRAAYEQTELLTRKMNKDLTDLIASSQQASEALKARSDFLARMSHELRTPLSAIISSSEMLLRTEQTPDQSELATIAVESGIHLLGLINDILDFSKLEAQKLKIEDSDFDLMNVLSVAVAAVKGKAAQKAVSVSVNAGPGVPRMVRCDSGRLRQILINLLDNAVKFTDQGKVQLYVSVGDEPGGSILRFLVRDTGRGVPASFTERLFQPFFQADGTVTRRYGGAGLGLSICKSLVELMEGQIGARSEIGQGSDFWFTIPLIKCRDSEQKVTTIDLPLVSRKIKGNRILVAEDNPVNARIASLQLTKLGYEVDVVGNGRFAVEAVAKKHYDLILMDVQMPEVDGLQATALIRHAEIGTDRRVPIVALTAHASPHDKDDCIFAGMDGYIAKPPGLTALSEVLQRFTSCHGHNGRVHSMEFSQSPGTYDPSGEES